MKCYLFDEAGKFTGEYIAQESPLEPGVFIIPENSTDITPPEILADEFLLWTGSQWQVNKIPAPEPVPEPTIEELRSTMVLTPAQARIKLASMGILTSVNSAINGMSETDAMRIKWEYATQIERLDPDLILFCTTTLNMTDTGIDNLFI